MKTSNSVKFFLNLAQVQSVLTRKFDNSLGGISLSEFMILLNLSLAADGKLRRTDLAEKVGLTVSGITRLLLPMEKIGLVKKQQDKNDARASFAVIAPGGKRKLAEGLERAEFLARDLISEEHLKDVEKLSQLMVKMGASLK